MVQDHKYLYRVLSWIFNFNICKLGRGNGGRHLLRQWGRPWQCQVEGAASPASAMWYSKHNGCDPHWRSTVAYVQCATVGKASFPLSLPKETDEPGALASEGYSPSWRVFSRIFNVFSLACRKFSSSAADTIRNALQTLTFPLIIPVKPRNADPTSVSRPDPFISVPMHPRKDMVMWLILA